MSSDAAAKLPPVRMSQAFRIARHLYWRNQAALLLLYASFLTIPMILRVDVFRRLFHAGAAMSIPEKALANALGSVIRSLIMTIQSSEPTYLSWAFAAMLEALIVPFAGAAMVVAVINLAMNDTVDYGDCARAVLRQSLSLAQFGILWYILLYVARYSLNDLDRALTFGGELPGVLLLIVWVIGYVLQFLGFIGALTCIMLDDIDPVRALCYGIWFGWKHALKLVLVLPGWAVLWFGLLSGAVVAYELSKSALLASFLLVVISTVISCYLSFALSFFAVNALAEGGYAASPGWLRLASLRSRHADDEVLGAPSGSLNFGG